MLRYSAEVLI